VIGKSDKLAKTGKLMVTIAAVAVDPTGLAATGAGLDAILHLHDSLANQHPGLTKLAAETQKAFDTALKEHRFDKPADARALLPQMLEHTLPNRNDFVTQGLDATQLLDTMLRRLTDPDHKRPEIITAFRNLYGPLLTQVCNDPRLKQALDPALTRDRVRREYRTEGKIDEILSRLGGLEGAVADPNSASFEDLIALASQFEETDFTTKAQVTKFLTLKAEEYRSYRTEINAIDERTKGLGNLKAAAQDAAENLNFAEVETLLSRVHEVEVEIAAETAELRATNALLRSRVEQAYHLLNAAADSFAAIDPLEPVNRRQIYMQRLYYHGRRHGGTGMAFAEQMIRAAIAQAETLDDKRSWAMCQNALAIALANQGSRTQGDTATALLAEAVTAFRNALTISAHDDRPLNWAASQNNLGNALRNQGSRTQGDTGTALLAEAVAAYRDALTIYTRDGHPLDWAMTQNNLGNALAEQGSRTHGNIGDAQLKESLAAYRDALTIRTRDDHPVQWAETQQNLAVVERDIADHATTTDPAPHLRAGLAHIEAALTVYDPNHMSYIYEQATTLRDQIRASLAESKP